MCYNKSRGDFVKDFIPVKSEKDVISIRINTKLLDEIDKAAGEADISRNELIVQCIEYAMKNIKK